MMFTISGVLPMENDQPFDKVGYSILHITDEYDNEGYNIEVLYKIDSVNEEYGVTEIYGIIPILHDNLDHIESYWEYTSPFHDLLETYTVDNTLSIATPGVTHGKHSVVYDNLLSSYNRFKDELWRDE